MKCKICHQNETDGTSGICWECCNTEIEEIYILDISNQIRILFYPYGNLIDWALNRYT